jgi:predicted nucleic-acid-binding Zn-ribbon protein
MAKRPGSVLARAAAAGDPAATVRQELRDKYREAIELVWKEPQDCPVCKSTAWSVGDLVDITVRNVESNVMRWPSPVYVYVPVTCLYCGYTLHFHSGVLDVRLSENIKAVPPLRLDQSGGLA